MQTIKPTVGRKIWFHPSMNHSEMNQLSDQPLDATVIFVHDDTCINLLVIDHMGHPHFVSKAYLQQPGGESVSGGQSYAEWMPYQVNQHRDQTAQQEAKVPHHHKD